MILLAQLCTIQRRIDWYSTLNSLLSGQSFPVFAVWWGSSESQRDGQKLGDIATLEELPDFTNSKIMESVQNIDVVWMKDEWPEYFFEVEHTTGVTSGLLRIYQAEKLPAKFFIIGPVDVLKRYEHEVEKAPFSRIKNKYRFRSYTELTEMYLTTSSFHKVSGHFLG